MYKIVHKPKYYTDSFILGPLLSPFFTFFSSGYTFSYFIQACLVSWSLLAFIHVILQAGRTPIMEAARKGHKEVIKVLLRFGAAILLTSHEVMLEQ